MKRPFHICDYDARHRLFIALGIAGLTYAALSFSTVRLPTRIITTWNSFAACALALTWFTIISAETHHIRKKAQTQDLSRRLIFVFTLIGVCASVFAVIFLLSSSKKTLHVVLHAALSIFAVASSWSLMHTIFAMRYAHIYYGDSDDPNKHVGGLEFPDKELPDYIDFAYFSFVIGMTSQVSDVRILSDPLRRLALFHGVLSFGFNTVILALTVSTVSGLL